MARLASTDLVAGGLAALAAALGYAAGSGGLLLAIGIPTAVAGLVRARVALTLVLFGVAPLLVVIGRSEPTLVVGALCLALAAGLWLAESRRSAPATLSELPEEVVATRIVLAAVFFVVVGALLRFAQAFAL